jgi:hypothetical protein
MSAAEEPDLVTQLGLSIRLEELRQEAPRWPSLRPRVRGREFRNILQLWIVITMLHYEALQELRKREEPRS